MLNSIRHNTGFFAITVAALLLVSGSQAQTADSPETEQTAATGSTTNGATKILSSKAKLEKQKAEQEEQKAEQEELALFCKDEKNSDETVCVNLTDTQ